MRQLLKDYMQYLQNENYASTTIDNRRSTLNNFVEYFEKDIADLDFQDIVDYISMRRETVKASTANLEKGTLRNFFKYCQMLKEIEMRFSYDVIKRRRDAKGNIKYLSIDQVRLAIDNMENPQDRLITAVLFETGMRISEVVGLRASDININEITVRGKGGDRELVFVTDELSKQLQVHMVKNEIYSGSVFRPLQIHKNNPNPDSYAIDSVRKRLKKSFADVGIEMHPHMLRHGFGTHLLRNKVDMRTIQRLMRHKSIETTMVYTHVTDYHMQEAHKSGFKQSVLV